MPDIFLYAGEANPNDVMLTDPTVVRGAGVRDARRLMMLLKVGCLFLALLMGL